MNRNKPKVQSFTGNITNGSVVFGDNVVVVNGVRTGRRPLLVFPQLQIGVTNEQLTALQGFVSTAEAVQLSSNMELVHVLENRFPWAMNTEVQCVSSTTGAWATFTSLYQFSSKQVSYAELPRTVPNLCAMLWLGVEFTKPEQEPAKVVYKFKRIMWKEDWKFISVPYSITPIPAVFAAFEELV